MDDVFSVAVLELYLDKIGEKYKVIRTRDKDIIENGDYVVDVGDIYDEDENRFDHHQESFKEVGMYKVPYSAFGLIWKHFGLALCENKNVWKKMVKDFVTQVDANDNGIDTYLPAIEGLVPIDPEFVTDSYLPAHSERTEETVYKGFLEAVEFAKGYLVREIRKENSKEEARGEFEHALKLKKNIFKTDSVQALILPRPLPWRDFLEEENDFDFVVSQRDDGKWNAQAVPPQKGSTRVKSFKRSWGGLRDQELCDKAGVPDLIYYHKTGYILVAKTKEAIIKALEKF
jgi:uncharacterized UPF0160 family protein